MSLLEPDPAPSTQSCTPKWVMHPILQQFRVSGAGKKPIPKEESGAGSLPSSCWGSSRSPPRTKLSPGLAQEDMPSFQDKGGSGPICNRSAFQELRTLLVNGQPFCSLQQRGLPVQGPSTQILVQGAPTNHPGTFPQDPGSNQL